MAAQLAQNALVDLQSLKDELGVPDASTDALLTRRINAASDACENYCKRKFGLKVDVQSVAVPSTQPPRIELRRTPVYQVVSVYQNADNGPILVDSSTYYLENAFAGILYRKGRWPGSALRRGDIVQDYDPGTEMENLQVTHLAGYVSITTAKAAPGWPGAGVQANVGDLLRVGASPNELLWVCTTAGLTSGGQPGGLSVAGALSVVGQNGLVAGKQVVDNLATWSYLGIVGDVGAALQGPACTLPNDLVTAALDTAISMWRNRGQDLSVKSKTVGRASTTWASRLGIPDSAVATLDRYARQVVG